MDFAQHSIVEAFGSDNGLGVRSDACRQVSVCNWVMKKERKEREKKLTPRNINPTPRKLLPIRHHTPFRNKMIKRQKVVSIHNRDTVMMKRERLNWLNRLGVFGNVGGDVVLREQKTIHDKVVVVGFISKISSVRHEFLAVLVLGAKTLVLLVRSYSQREIPQATSPLFSPEIKEEENESEGECEKEKKKERKKKGTHVVSPLPDKSTHEPWVLIKQVDILLCVAFRVPHRVQKLAQNKGLLPISLFGKFFDKGQVRVHAAEDVDRLRILIAFVVDQTTIIHDLDGIVHGLVVLSVE